MTSLDKAAHHKASRCTEKRQKYTEQFVQNIISSEHKSFLDLFSFQKDKMMTNDMFELDMLAWSFTIVCKDGEPE